jgi:hypothetical protein
VQAGEPRSTSKDPGGRLGTINICMSTSPRLMRISTTLPCSLEISQSKTRYPIEIPFISLRAIMPSVFLPSLVVEAIEPRLFGWSAS